MKAAGVLYAPHMKQDRYPESHAFFWRSTANATSSDVRFWMLLDEPEQGLGEWEEAKAKADEPTGQIVPLPYVYNLYYLCSVQGNLPYSINIFDPIFYEEYAFGADILSSNPWVKTPTEEDQDTTLRVTDAVKEMKKVTGDTKKVILIQWWWNPNDKNNGANDADTLGNTFDKAIDAGADGVGGWNFSGSYENDEGEQVIQRLSLCSMPQNIRDLWAKICEKNESISPSS